MLCEKCNQPNPDENNFCGKCGAALPEKGRVTLKNVLDAGILKAGDDLTIRVRGQELTATLLADGRIKCQDETYDGPLSCATALRGQTCDSWFCWNAKDPATGRGYSISHFRAALLGQLRRGPPAP